MSSASVTALSFSCFSSSDSLLFCSFICASNAILSCCCCSTIFFCFFISTHFCLSSCNVVVNDNVSRSFSSACIVRVPFNRSNCSTLCLLAFNCNVNAWTFFWCSWVKCFLVFELVETKNKTKTKNQPKKQNTKHKTQKTTFFVRELTLSWTDCFWYHSKNPILLSYEELCLVLVLFPVAIDAVIFAMCLKSF